MSMSSKTDIADIANWFLAKESMTHKKLQKICYYAVAWGWALMGKPIAINGEFQAWRHGPVSRTIYDRYAGSGWNLIPKTESEKEAPDDINELLEAVWLTYGDKTGNELEALSHSEKPWIEARTGLSASDSSMRVIKTSTMQQFYNSIKSTEF